MQRPKFSGLDKRGPVIYDFIKANPLCNQDDICVGTGLVKQTVRRVARRLVQREYIHVAAHQRPEGGGTAIFLYEVGPAKGDPDVLKSSQEYRLIMVREKTYEQARQQIQAAVVSGGAMAAMAVQLSNTE